MLATGGAVFEGVGTTNLAIATPDLNTQKRGIAIGEVRNGMVYVSVQEQLRQQRQVEAIEAAFEALTTQVGDNTSLLSAIITAQQKADAAIQTANSVQAQAALTDSFVEPSSVVTANPDGSIDVIAHRRTYVNGSTRTSVEVGAGSVSGFMSGDYVTVFYRDAGRSGGAVTYEGTTSAIGQTGSVHIVGQVTIPQAGQTPSPGRGPSAPGFEPDERVPQNYEDWV